jgi:hypothetical protein
VRDGGQRLFEVAAQDFLDLPPLAGTGDPPRLDIFRAEGDAAGVSADPEAALGEDQIGLRAEFGDHPNRNRVELRPVVAAGTISRRRR